MTVALGAVPPGGAARAGSTQIMTSVPAPKRDRKD